jgi:hypothetical protein
MERRAKQRISADFPAKFRFTGRDGWKVELSSLVKNISASGLYLHSPRRIEPRETLFLVIRFLSPVSPNRDMAKIAVKGVVVRIDSLPGGHFGLGISMKQRRFL